MKQIDNFLNQKDLTDLKQVILDPTFPWALNHGVSYPDDGHIQFTHTIYKDNEFKSTFTLGGLDIFKEKLGIISLVRAKLNLLPRNEKIIEHQTHIDIPNPPDNLKTAILYLNTNYGYIVAIVLLVAIVFDIKPRTWNLISKVFNNLNDCNKDDSFIKEGC